MGNSYTWLKIVVNVTHERQKPLIQNRPITLFEARIGLFSVDGRIRCSECHYVGEFWSHIFVCARFGVTETVCERSSEIFSLTKDTFDAVSMPVAFNLQIGVHSLQCSLEMLGSIDEKHGANGARSVSFAHRKSLISEDVFDVMDLVSWRFISANMVVVIEFSRCSGSFDFDSIWYTVSPVGRRSELRFCRARVDSSPLSLTD
ncbi:hypothetical protein [Halorhabdus amylolytica]|uniref:hypothetical protein n=1 Tax=Halorhabdus amylolytica TaxID=2559573 RepID=UPI0010AB17B9